MEQDRSRYWLCRIVLASLEQDRGAPGGCNAQRCVVTGSQCDLQQPVKIMPWLVTLSLSLAYEARYLRRDRGERVASFLTSCLT